GVALRGGGLQRLIARERLKVLEALARGFVLRARLAERRPRVVDVLLRDRAFTVQLLAAGQQRLLRVHGILRGAHVHVRLLYFLWNGGLRRGYVGGLGLFERRAVFGRRAGEIAVLELDEQLAGAHLSAALHVDLPDRRRDLRD